MLLSGIFLALGMIGFAISPIIFDSNISKYRDEISNYEYYRQLASKNLYDAADWYRYAGITSNNASVLSKLKADHSILKRKKTDYINESKFSLNSLFVAIQSAKGKFEINEEELWNKWSGITEPDEFFKLQKKYSSLAMAEMQKLEIMIKNKNNRINTLKIRRKWLWIICIFLQSFGMFSGTYYTHLKER